MSDWYFAYGSNLWIDQMVRRTGPVGQGEDQPRVVRLAGYRLTFNMLAENGYVYANIERAGTGVIGVIYRCGPETLNRLDDFEAGYDRLKLTVVDDLGASIEATAYIAKPERIAADGKPSDEYLKRILRGAREHGLPDDYINSIMAIASGDR